MSGTTLERARRRWPEILPRLGVDTRFLTNNHGPCPICGGKDRYRFDNKDGSGSYYCHQCGPGSGVILLRKRMLEEAAVVARGGEPKAVVRDRAKNVKIALPRIRRGRGAPMGVTPDRPRPMLWHAGQPREIAEEIERLWAQLGGRA